MLVIFDMDGTLFRTETVDIEAINRALALNSFPEKTPAEIFSAIGRTLPEVCSFLSGCGDEAVIERLSEDIIELEDQLIPSCGELYEGTLQMLEGLKKSGFRLCICSNGNAEYIDKIVGKFRLDSYFDDICYSRRGITKSQAVGLLKEKYGGSSFIMVGDRSSDIGAAAENGGISIGVTYGFGMDEPLAADFVAHSIGEVGELVHKIAEIQEKVRA